MSHASVFVSAVLAALLLGAASAGAADEPVATAPIPPPLPVEPLSPATPMVIPATPTPKKADAPRPAASGKKSETAAGAPRQKPETTAHAPRPKRPVSRHARKTAPRKPAEKAAEKMAAEEAAVAAAADAAERETARQRAAATSRNRYHEARRAPPQTPPAWATPQPFNEGTSDDEPYPPGPVGDGRPQYYAEYPRPRYYGPAYPPPWYNGLPSQDYAPGDYADRYYPNRWRRGPMPPW